MEARGAFELALAVFIRCTHCRTARARKLKLKSAQSVKDTESQPYRQSCKQFLQIPAKVSVKLSTVLLRFPDYLPMYAAFHSKLCRTLFCLLAVWLNHATASPCGELRVAFYEHGALYYLDQQQKAHGIDLDIIDELERRSGCQFIRNLDSRVRIWHQIEQASLDMTVSGIPNPEREKFAYFLIYLNSRNYALLQQDLPKTAYTLQGFLDHGELKLGVIKSFRHGPVYDQLIQQLRSQNRILEVADFASLYRIFKARRVDAIIGLPTSWGQADMRHNYLSEAQVMDWAPHEKIEAGLVISKARVPANTVQLLQHHLKAMLQDGSVLKIFKRHISDASAYNTLPEPYR